MKNRRDLDPYASINGDTPASAASSSTSSAVNISRFFPIPGTQGQEKDVLTVSLKSYPFKHHLKKPKPQADTEKTPLLPPPEPVNLNIDLIDDDAEANDALAANGEQVENEICCCLEECCCGLSAADWSYMLLCTLGWTACGVGTGWVTGAGLNCCCSSCFDGSPVRFHNYGISDCDPIWFTTQESVSAISGNIRPATVPLWPTCDMVQAAVGGLVGLICCGMESIAGTINNPYVIRR